MEHCRDCNATLKPEEKECWACGAAVIKTAEKPSPAARFAVVAKYLFFASAVMTVASLFFSATPPFSKCLVATVVLLLVKSSAEQMLEKTKG